MLNAKCFIQLDAKEDGDLNRAGIVGSFSSLVQFKQVKLNVQNSPKPSFAEGAANGNN